MSSYFANCFIRSSLDCLSSSLITSMTRVSMTSCTCLICAIMLFRVTSEAFWSPSLLTLTAGSGIPRRVSPTNGAATEPAGEVIFSVVAGVYVGPVLAIDVSVSSTRSDTLLCSGCLSERGEGLRMRFRAPCRKLSLMSISRATLSLSFTSSPEF